MGDMTRHCNPSSAALAMSRGAALFSAGVAAVGVAADAVGGGPVMGAVAQIAADLAAAAMSALLGKDPGIPPAFGALMMGAPTVLIGGFPCPNLPNPLDAMMHGLKCLGKAFLHSKGFGKLLNKVGYCNDPGEPISTFTGEVYNDLDDFGDTESGFIWTRHYRSSWNESDGPLGYGYRHFFQRTLTLLRKRAVYEAYDNEVVALRKLDDGTFAPVDGYSLRAVGGSYELRTDRNELLVFSLQNSPTSGRLERYRTAESDVYLYYAPDGRLRALSEFIGGRPIDTHFVYDAGGRIIEVRRAPRGESSKFIARYNYDRGCIVEFIDALGATTRYAYDLQRRMSRATGPSGYSFHWLYDAKNGRCIKSLGDDGHLGVEATYSGTHSTFTETDGSVWTFKHYPNGGVSHIVAPDGGVTQYVQDDNGKVVSQVTPGGLEYTWLYEDGKHTGRLDPFGFIVPPEDEEPNPWTFEPDLPQTAKGYLCGRSVELVGKGVGAVPAQVSAALQAALARAGVRWGAAISNEYDLAGRLISESQPDGSVHTFVFDAEDNVVAEHVGPPGAAAAPLAPGTRGDWTTRVYSSWNLLSAEAAPSGSTVRYEYTHRGKWRALIDPVGNRTDYFRDGNHRIVEVHRYGGPYRRYRYTVGGTLVETRDGAGKLLVSYASDERGQHAKKTLASGESYEYEYDRHGRCTKASSSQHDVRLAHQRSLRQLDERDGKGVAHTYDDKGRLSHTTYFGRLEVNYCYLKRAKLRIATPDGSEHRFWLSQREVVRENANGTIEALLFDSDERLAARACWRHSEALAAPFWTAAYQYGPGGTLLTDADSEHPATYGYDEDRRLVAQQDGRGVRRYAYDPASNLILTPRHHAVKHAQGNLLASAGFEHFLYDDQKRLAQRSLPGNRTISYSYDSLDQLIEARADDSPHVWRAGYDGLGRRIWREFAGKRTEFYWDGERLAAERAPDGSLRLYVYPNEDALVPFMWLDYAHESDAAETGRAFFLFTAPTGLPIRVENAIGAEIWRARHVDAYGSFDEAEAPCPTRLRFAGHYYDEYLQLHYNRFRDYDPALGRYLQPDPLGHAGGINLFAYTSNPLVEVDIQGLKVPHRKQKTKEPSDAPGSEKDSPSRNRKKGKETDLVDEHGNPKKPLSKMTDKELKDFAKRRAEQLNRSLHPEVAKRTTTAVTIVENPPGDKKSRKVVITSSENKVPKLPNKKKDKGKPRASALAPGEEMRETPPKLKRVPPTKDAKGRTKPGGLVDENGKPYPKAKKGDDGKGKTEHHAEQRAQRSANDNGEGVKAMAPTKKCCPGCQSALSKGGNLDKVPPSLQGTPEK